jgi:hypothetical protein
MADRGTGRDVVVVADMSLRHIRRNAEQAGACADDRRETGLRKPIPVGNLVPRDPIRRRSFVKAAEPNAHAATTRGADATSP